MKKLYSVYRELFGNEPSLEMQSVEVVAWGKGYKAVGHAGLAFGCRSRFAVGDFAESEQEAWERCRKYLLDSIEHCEKEIKQYSQLLQMVDAKLLKA